MSQVNSTIDYEEREERSDEESFHDPSEDSYLKASFDSSITTPQYHIQKAEASLQFLKTVVKEPGWKKVLHKSGVTVFSKPGVKKEDKSPIFMGEYIIEGFTPQSVFAVVGVRKLWDDWYEEGSLIENLNETTSLTYMVMKAFAGSKTRDLSLVEKIECSESGTICFTSTSVETPRVPRTANRIRAQIQLNGWILEPLSYDPPRTNVTYVLQTNIKGWIPSILAKTYMSRRPLVLHVIDQYLQRNGPPPIAVSTAPRASSDILPKYQPNDSMDTVEVKSLRKKISFADISEVASKNVSKQRSAISDSIIEESRGDSSSSRGNSSLSKGPSSPKIPPRTVSSMQPLSSKMDDVNAPQQEPVKPKPTQEPVKPEPTQQEPVKPEPKQQEPVKPKPTQHQATPAKPLQHRHTESIQRAIEKFKSHMPMDGWVIDSESSGVKIHMKKSGKSTPIMRGDAVISGGFTTYDILSVIMNLDTRRLWDDRFDEGATYERFGLHEHLTRAAMKGTFPISGRDMSVCGTVDHGDNGILRFVTTSVIDPLIPESKKHVRSELDFAGWELKPHFDADKKTISVDVTYIVNIDIKLDTIPSSILKSLMNQIPTIIAKIGGLMRKSGFPPYVINTTTKVITEKFHVKNSQCDLSLIAEKDGVTEFVISKLMYPNGVDVSVIPENCKVELLSTSTETIRVTLPSRVDLDTLSITVHKRSEGYRMTYNNGQEMPMALDSDNNEDKPSNHSNVTDATLVNGKNHKPYSKSMVSPETFVKSLEVPLKLEPYQRMLEKQTLLENKITAVTQSSREIQDVPAPLKEEKEEQVTDSPIIKERIELIPKNEVIGNNNNIGNNDNNNTVTSDNTQNANVKNTMSLKDSVRFNTQQVGLMFASMLLAYYAGKLSTN